MTIADKLRNRNRKLILTELYTRHLRYRDIVELTGLKPGSIYHHLSVLAPLVEKGGEGVYRITDLGRDVVESMGLVEIKRPVVEGHPEPMLEFWLSRYVVLILVISMVQVIVLGLRGVAFAGSSIYGLAPMASIYISIFAVVAGVGVLYVLEDITTTHTPEKLLSHALTIRGVSMVPGIVVGSSLLILFMAGVAPGRSAYVSLYVLTSLAGWGVAAVGHNQLRGTSFPHSVMVAGGAILVDILIGAAVLFSV